MLNIAAAGNSVLIIRGVILNILYVTLQGRPQDLGGGGKIFLFRFGNLHVAKRHAAHGKAMRIARGVRKHAPPRKLFKTVQFGAF